MEGSFERQVREDVMRKVDEKYKKEIKDLYGVVDKLRIRFTGYSIVTCLVASLIGGGVGYVLNNNSKKEIRDLDTKVWEIYLQSTVTDNPILPDSVTNDGLSITNPSKSVSGEVMDYGKRLIHPMPVPESNKRLESSIEGY